jgi:hypothetical protein
MGCELKFLIPSTLISSQMKIVVLAVFLLQVWLHVPKTLCFSHHNKSIFACYKWHHRVQEHRPLCTLRFHFHTGDITEYEGPLVLWDFTCVRTRSESWLVVVPSPPWSPQHCHIFFSVGFILSILSGEERGLLRPTNTSRSSITVSTGAQCRQVQGIFQLLWDGLS